MIAKSELNKILFIEKYVHKREVFIKELFKSLNLLKDGKLTKEQFSSWLNSWEARAELDKDPNASDRIKKAYREIKSQKTPHKTWEDFKRHIGIKAN